MKLPKFLVSVLLRVHAWGMKRPFHDLKEYMLRGWVLGYHSANRNDGNEAWHGRSRGRFHEWLTAQVCVRAHTTLRSDNDRHNHDHPAGSVSVVLGPGYFEVHQPNALAVARQIHYRGLIELLPYVKPEDVAEQAALFNIHWRGPGAVVFRKATDAHRLILPAGTQCKSLFVMFKKPPGHKWGYYTPDGKIPHNEYDAYLARKLREGQLHAA